MLIKECFKCKKSAPRYHQLPIQARQASTGNFCSPCTLLHLGINEVPIDSKLIINRRSDLSTFVIHLCRDSDDGKTLARDAFKSILEPKKPFLRAGEGSGLFAYSSDWKQHTGSVCFTEMPLEHVYSFTMSMKGRKYHFKPYGLVFSKKVALSRGVSPVWYMNGFSTVSPGLVDSLLELVASLTESQKQHFQQIAPFLEQWDAKRDFYWEREWRHRGHFLFEKTEVILGICPRRDIRTFEAEYDPIRFFDPTDGLDSIIAKLAQR